MGHHWEGKKLLYRVKWKGYSHSDDTDEPPENIEESAPDVMAEYFTLIKGSPQPGTEYSKAVLNEDKKKPKKKPATKKSAPAKKVQSEESDATVEDNTPPPKKRQKTVPSSQPKEPKEWAPPPGVDWEAEVRQITTIEKDDRGGLVILVDWRNGKSSRINNAMVRKKCPQKMLDFYENHLSVGS